ncbi:MAG TPA: hypothetical protein VLK85_14600 [Ramlibacter sp.]|nr:hypothetical protein [Ramlibacter sp.]
MLRATKIAEEIGVRGVAVVASGFMGQARATSRAMGAPQLRLAEYPGVIPLDSPEMYAAKARDNVLPAVIEALSREVPAGAAAMEQQPGPRDIVFSGSLQEVQDFFEAREWSDGLPFVPPTRELVQQFLAWTDRDPAEVIGVLPPEGREATVWSVAVNGVMAGCRPEYMTILLAAVDAIADPSFRLCDAGSTPSWEPLVVVSGELARALNFNTSVGNMKMGRRANAAIGRFLRLYIRNVAGFRPGTTDKGSIGFTFNVAMAEDEEATAALGWDPLRVELGFARDDNMVMVQSVVATSFPIYCGGTEPETLAWPFVRYMVGTPGPYNYTAMYYGGWYPLIQISPSVAKNFAAGGWGKKELRDYLYQHCKTEAGSLEHYQMHVAGQAVKLRELVGWGACDPLYAASDDPARLVPTLIKPERTRILVAGDPGRNQSKIYFNNHEQGPPVMKRVALPPDWRSRLSKVS